MIFIYSQSQETLINIYVFLIIILIHIHIKSNSYLYLKPIFCTFLPCSFPPIQTLMEEKKKKKKEKIKPFFDFLSLQDVILSDVLGGKEYRKSM